MTTKQVPVEPTVDMLVSGQEAWTRMRPKRNAVEDCEEAMAVYKAMLAAATAAPSVEPVAWRYRWIFADTISRNGRGRWHYEESEPDPAEDKEIEPLFAAPTVSERDAEWMPIETAPKDRPIDIWINSGVRWPDCYYDSICDQWRTSRPSGHLIQISARHVTHWRELPDPPTAIRALVATPKEK